MILAISIVDLMLHCAIIISAQKKIKFCGAKRPLYLYRNGVLQEFQGNRNSVGLFSIAGKVFKETEIQLQKNDQLFLFSDGYSDQIGGPRKKRYMSKTVQRDATGTTAHLFQKATYKIVRNYSSMEGS